MTDSYSVTSSRQLWIYLIIYIFHPTNWDFFAASPPRMQVPGRSPSSERNTLIIHYPAHPLYICHISSAPLSTLFPVAVLSSFHNMYNVCKSWRSQLETQQKGVYQMEYHCFTRCCCWCWCKNTCEMRHKLPTKSSLLWQQLKGILQSNFMVKDIKSCQKGGTRVETNVQPNSRSHFIHVLLSFN